METGVSYFGNRILKHVKEDMEDIKSHHCSYVVHTFSESDFYYYKETMREIVHITQSIGLKVYLDPWGVGRIFGGEPFSRFVMVNKDACQIDNSGKILPAACPNNKEFIEFLCDWTAVAVSFKPEYIFWDEPHFVAYRQTDRWACRCESCQKKFFEMFKKDMPQVRTEEVTLFLQASIIGLLEKLCGIVKSAGVRNSICFLPYEEPRLATSNWETFAKLDFLDMIGTDPYWLLLNEDITSCVSRLSRRISELAKKYNKEAQIWIQNFKIPAGKEDDIVTAIDLAYKEGIRNFAAWSYWGCGMMSEIKSDNPDKVWETLSKKYAQLHTMT